MPTFPDGPFLASSAEAFGWTDVDLRRLTAQGVLRRVLTGVYAPARLGDSLELRIAAAALALPPHVVISDRSAAWLHDVNLYDLDRLEVPPRLEVVSIPGHDRTRRPEMLGGKRELTDDDVCRLGGLPVTTPVRTACDLACLRGRYAALAVLDAFMRHHGLTRDDLRAVARRFKGRRGVIQLRELIEYADADAESPGESWTRMAIIDARLPMPKLQHWVTLPEVGRVRLDLAYPKERITVEYDGEEFHSDDADKEADRLRRQALRDAGWVVIVVKKDDFKGEALDAWLGQLKNAVFAREAVVRRIYARGESNFPGARAATR